MKQPYVPKRTITVQIPIELYDKLEELAEGWNTTKTGALIKILKEASAT